MSEVSITYVICNGGDGSNFIEWVIDEAVLDKMEELADDGDECYVSGDGLQTRTLIFKDQEQLDYFIARNRIRITTIDKFMRLD